MVRRLTVVIAMTLRLMLHCAAAAMLLAGQAAAQAPAPGAVGACDVAAMTPQTHAALDKDADGELTLDEFGACPGATGLPIDPAQAGAFETAFAGADGDADGRLTLSEIEQAGATGTAEAAPPASVAPQGTVTVTQPAPQVEVTQPAAEVTVTQPAPAVAVEAPAPTVAVEAAAPSVAVTPTAPSGEVAREAPELPAPRPATAADEPSTPAESGLAPAAPAAPAGVAASPAPVAAPAAVDASGGATVSAPMPEDFQINVADLNGKDVMNTAGEEVGTVADVLLDPRTDRPVVIVAVGGILGIGDREVPFPYSEFTITGDEVVLNSALTSEQIEDMPEYEEGSYEPLPDTMRVP